ncbi:MAG: DUF3306 domain-containing protein [Bosea sp. (in: a-proteobacteria)]
MTTPDDADDKQDGFLGRWSRRKLSPQLDAGPKPEEEAAALPTAAEPDTRPRDPETGELIDEDIVSRLPHVEDLKAGGDLSAFMQKGVPEALRREALRTMWLNDPMIRNYVSPALDYAYDYNIPGGAPGYGPLTESDMANAREFLADIFSTPQKQPDDATYAHNPGNCDNVSHSHATVEPNAIRRSDGALQNAAESDVAADFANAVREPADFTQTPQSAEVAIVQRNMTDPSDAPTTAPKRRRGGGAAPM